MMTTPIFWSYCIFSFINCSVMNFSNICGSKFFPVSLNLHDKCRCGSVVRLPVFPLIAIFWPALTCWPLFTSIFDRGRNEHVHIPKASLYGCPSGVMPSSEVLLLRHCQLACLCLLLMSLERWCQLEPPPSSQRFSSVSLQSYGFALNKEPLQSLNYSGLIEALERVRWKSCQ